MEFPNLGSNCSEGTCNKLDFLPVKCDGCHKLFCVNHMTYSNHNCPTPKIIDNQVPVCPLCNKPVPSNRGETPDISVNAHIERDCQSDPAKSRRKVFTRCSVKSCKNKEAVPIICDKCSFSYCVFHRHPSDHKCNEKSKPTSNAHKNNSVPRNEDFSRIQGYMSEDEALAYAIAISSMPEESDRTNFSQTRSNAIHNNNNNNNCSVS